MQITQIVLLELPPYGGAVDIPYAGKMKIIKGRLIEGRRWIAHTPVFVCLNAGRIDAITRGGIIYEKQMAMDYF